MKKQSQKQLKLNIPNWMIIDAVRYATGRRSTQVSTTSEWVISNWAFIDDIAQDQIKRDLEAEFEYDDRLRALKDPKSSFHPLGHDYDRKCWEKVRALWKEVK